MTIGPREVMRSDIEGGLSGPADSIPEQSIDCGCKLLPCPRLARFATRRLYVGLLCWIGLIQAAEHAYLIVTNSTITRRFQFDPYLMDWILAISGISPFIFGLLLAYWGDRIHRVAWTGALVLLQSAGYLILIIPHFTHHMKIIEETENVTHMSLYADDSSELCSAGVSRIVIEKEEPCYSTLVVLIGVQILSAMANIGYYSLGISYLDDNTKKKHVAALVGLVLATRFLGALLGYILAWGCLRLDAENFNIVESYQEQIGAWWLGWPILTILLAIPGLLLAMFPRRLPSEVIQQAAESILDLAGRPRGGSRRFSNRKIGSTRFLPSLARLISNKILICNVLAAVFCATAVVNFMANENIFLESRFYVPKPTGMLLGFGDPWISRMITTILRPVLVGLVVIISGLTIVRTKPQARYIAGYNVVVVVLAATVILALAFATCDKPPIVGKRRGTIELLRYCNKNCRCSRDADFRPICDDARSFTFYSPCHAGCSVIDDVDGTKVYDNCKCVEETTGLGNDRAWDGPCGSSSCQIGWLTFQMGSILVCALLASSIVGNLLINLRCVYAQDKSLTLGFELTWVAIFTYVPGKILYQKIADLTCQHWGLDRTICHLHDSDSLGNYLCYLTTLLLIIGAIFKALVFVFCDTTKIYDLPEAKAEPTELKALARTGSETLMSEEPGSSGTRPGDSSNPTNANVTSESLQEAAIVHPNSIDKRSNEDLQTSSRTTLKYGPLGPGDPRTGTSVTAVHETLTSNPRNADSEDELYSISDDESNAENREASPKIEYRPLDLESDVESDLSSIGPRSRRKVLSKDFEPSLNSTGIASFPMDVRRFPNPDHYEKNPETRTIDAPKSPDSMDSLREDQGQSDGFSKTDSFEYARKRRDNNGILKKPTVPYRPEGDFNEVGIPVMNDPEEIPVTIRTTHFLKELATNRPDNIEIEPDLPPPRRRSSSRGQTSSGFGSLPDIQEKASPSLARMTARSQDGLGSSTSVSSSKLNKPPPLNTDL